MKRSTVSLCIIARNEEASIGQTIKSALAVVDEIVVGDTGSDDNTRLIAEGYGARVSDVPWQDDFAAARNTVLAEARGDWILVLDADERLHPIRPVEFQRLLADARVAGYRVDVVAEPAAGRQLPDRRQVRLFRNHPFVRFVYPVHDTVEIALANWASGRGLEIRDAPLKILHDLSDPARQRRARQRNLRLLRRACGEYPYEPFFAWRLADETVVRLEDEVLPVAGLARTTELLERAWRFVAPAERRDAPQPPFAPQLAELLVHCLLAQERTGEALGIAREATLRFPDDERLSLARAVALVRHLELGGGGAGAADLVAEARACLDPLVATAPGATERWRWVVPLRYLGRLELVDDAPAEAERHFDTLLRRDPLTSCAWSGKGDCALRLGERRRALACYLRAVTLDEHNLQAWLRGSLLLNRLGFRDNARTWLQRVETLFPEYPVFQQRGELTQEMLDAEPMSV